MSATMSLLGLYQNNPSMFLELALPDGVDRNSVIDNLLMETAELEILYPNPYFMQAAIGTWSAKELPVWQKLYTTTVLEYDPIQNYDRKENWTEDEKRDVVETNQSRESSSTESSGNSTQTRKNDESVDTSHYVSAFNETTFTPTSRDTEQRDAVGSTSQEDSGTVDTSANASGSANSSEKRAAERKGAISGNTGFYTKQKMIEQEREVVKFNIIDHITNSFKNRFCLLIY